MRSAPRSPVWIPADAPAVFPNPSDFDRAGLVAGGGDLSVARLLAAYRRGLFPWYNEPPILWWSPDPRGVIDHTSLHISRSLKRALRQTHFTVTCNTAFKAVMDGCAEREEGTWLTDEMKAAYLALEQSGHALSYEVWHGAELVGGLYGVRIGGLYAAESKFHRRTNASKIALVCAVTDLFSRGLQLFDVQFETEHLKTLGVFEMTRAEYLSRLPDACGRELSPPSPTGNLLPQVLDLLGLTEAPRKI